MKTYISNLGYFAKSFILWSYTSIKKLKTSFSLSSLHWLTNTGLFNIEVFLVSFESRFLRWLLNFSNIFHIVRCLTLFWLHLVFNRIVKYGRANIEPLQKRVYHKVTILFIRKLLKAEALYPNSDWCRSVN